MSLCSRCATVNLHTLTQDLTSQSGVDDGQSRVRRGMVHLENGSDLAESALHCPLCAIIQAALLQALQSISPTAPLSLSLSLSHDPIILTPKKDPLGATFPDPPTKGAHLTGISISAIEMGSRRLLQGKLRFFANEQGLENGDVAPYDIIGRPRLLSPDSEPAFTMLRRWIEACHQQHSTCRELLSGEFIDQGVHPELPTRVVSVENDTIKVLHSAGSRGRYAALSYCWGPLEKQPLRTTQSNLQSHLNGISWDVLPKTFRDAITVARRIGIPYIWIDSLCIVQDDEEDWLQESKQMGSIYEQAELTIAACHAVDSQEGFFFPRLPPPPIVELPNFLPAKSGTARMVYASIRLDTVTDTFPEHGALNFRAWATQEWLLSRRMVFFTKGVIVWSCKMITQRETGDRCYNVSRDTHWKTVVERYSDRQLTVATDKMIALEGLRTQMQRKNGHRYAFGVWLECLPNQLLWQVSEQASGLETSNVLKLPTWTWAWVPCGVRFLIVNGAKNMCGSVALSSGSRRITIRSRVKRVSALDMKAHLELDSDDVVTRAMNIDLSKCYVKQTRKMAKYVVDEANDNATAVGWVVFDGLTHHDAGLDQEITLIALMGGMSRRQEEMERRGGKVSLKKLREYWVLAVRPAEDGTYCRVGVGKTYGREWWQETAEEVITVV